MRIYVNYPFIKNEHSWRMKESIRIRKELMKNTPFEEKIIYRELKKNLAMECHIQRQKVIFTPKSFYIADLFLKKYKLVIEIDGIYHNSKKQKAIDLDKEKHFLLRENYRFIRIKNEEIYSNLKNIIYNILALAREPLRS